MKLVIPKKEMLIKTSIEDALEFYYKPIFSYVFRKRLKMCIKLLNGYKFDRMLDAGYGAGIFFFSLNKICKEMYGIDEHKKHKEIREKYKKYGLNLKLASGDIANLPYENEFFDGLVSISTLEHIKGLDIVISEFHRVLKKDNYLFAGFPVKNKITDTFYKIMTPFLKEKKDILNDIHVSSHKDIIKAIEKKFKIIKIIKLPTFLPRDISSYVCLKAKKI